jgi:hypothetical protein
LGSNAFEMSNEDDLFDILGDSPASLIKSSADRKREQQKQQSSSQQQQDTINKKVAVLHQKAAEDVAQKQKQKQALLEQQQREEEEIMSYALLDEASTFGKEKKQPRKARYARRIDDTSEAHHNILL